MSDQTERSETGAGQEEQKPSPEEHASGGVGSGPEGEDAEGTDGGDRSGRQREAAKPPRGEPGSPTDT